MLHLHTIEAMVVVAARTSPHCPHNIRGLGHGHIYIDIAGTYGHGNTWLHEMRGRLDSLEWPRILIHMHGSKLH